MIINQLLQPSNFKDSWHNRWKSCNRDTGWKTLVIVAMLAGCGQWISKGGSQSQASSVLST